MFPQQCLTAHAQDREGGRWGGASVVTLPWKQGAGALWLSEVWLKDGMVQASRGGKSGGPGGG